MIRLKITNTSKHIIFFMILITSPMIARRIGAVPYSTTQQDATARRAKPESSPHITYSRFKFTAPGNDRYFHYDNNGPVVSEEMTRKYSLNLGKVDRHKDNLHRLGGKVSESRMWYDRDYVDKANAGMTRKLFNHRQDKFSNSWTTSGILRKYFGLWLMDDSKTKREDNFNDKILKGTELKVTNRHNNKIDTLINHRGKHISNEYIGKYRLKNSRKSPLNQNPNPIAGGYHQYKSPTPKDFDETFEDAGDKFYFYYYDPDDINDNTNYLHQRSSRIKQDGDKDLRLLREEKISPRNGVSQGQSSKFKYDKKRNVLPTNLRERVSSTEMTHIGVLSTFFNEFNQSNNYSQKLDFNSSVNDKKNKSGRREYEENSRVLRGSLSKSISKGSSQTSTEASTSTMSDILSKTTTEKSERLDTSVKNQIVDYDDVKPDMTSYRSSFAGFAQNSSSYSKNPRQMEDMNALNSKSDIMARLLGEDGKRHHFVKSNDLQGEKELVDGGDDDDDEKEEEEEEEEEDEEDAILEDLTFSPNISQKNEIKTGINTTNSDRNAGTIQNKNFGSFSSKTIHQDLLINNVTTDPSVNVKMENKSFKNSSHSFSTYRRDKELKTNKKTSKNGDPTLNTDQSLDKNSRLKHTAAILIVDNKHNGSNINSSNKHSSKNASALNEARNSQETKISITKSNLSNLTPNTHMTRKNEESKGRGNIEINFNKSIPLGHQQRMKVLNSTPELSLKKDTAKPDGSTTLILDSKKTKYTSDASELFMQSDKLSANISQTVAKNIPYLQENTNSTSKENNTTRDMNEESLEVIILSSFKQPQTDFTKINGENESQPINLEQNNRIKRKPSLNLNVSINLDNMTMPENLSHHSIYKEVDQTGSNHVLHPSHIYYYSPKSIRVGENDEDIKQPVKPKHKNVNKNSSANDLRPLTAPLNSDTQQRFTTKASVHNAFKYSTVLHKNQQNNNLTKYARTIQASSRLVKLKNYSLEAQKIDSTTGWKSENTENGLTKLKKKENNVQSSKENQQNGNFTKYYREKKQFEVPTLGRNKSTVALRSKQNHNETTEASEKKPRHNRRLMPRSQFVHKLTLEDFPSLILRRQAFSVSDKNDNNNIKNNDYENKKTDHSNTNKTGNNESERSGSAYNNIKLYDSSSSGRNKSYNHDNRIVTGRNNDNRIITSRNHDNRITTSRNHDHRIITSRNKNEKTNNDQINDNSHNPTTNNNRYNHNTNNENDGDKYYESSRKAKNTNSNHSLRGRAGDHVDTKAFSFDNDDDDKLVISAGEGDFKVPRISAYMAQNFSLRKPEEWQLKSKVDPQKTESTFRQSDNNNDGARHGTNGETPCPTTCNVTESSSYGTQGVQMPQLQPVIPQSRAAVSAVLTSHFGPTKQQIIPFDLELIDLADNYDNNTGMFIATIPGTYVISVYLMSHPGAKVNARVYVNDRPVAALWADDSAHAGFYPSSSIQTIAQLGFGDQAYVMLVDGGYGDSWVHANYNVFTVFLLYEETFS